MIKIDFSSAISTYLCLSIFLVFVLWIFYNYRKNGILNETKYLQQCPYCTYMFFNYASQAPDKTQNANKKEEGILEENLVGAKILKTEDLNTKKANALTCPRCKSYIDL